MKSENASYAYPDGGQTRHRYIRQHYDYYYWCEDGVLPELKYGFTKEQNNNNPFLWLSFYPKRIKFIYGSGSYNSYTKMSQIINYYNNTRPDLIRSYLPVSYNNELIPLDFNWDSDGNYWFITKTSVNFNGHKYTNHYVDVVDMLSPFTGTADVIQDFGYIEDWNVSGDDIIWLSPTNMNKMFNNQVRYILTPEVVLLGDENNDVVNVSQPNEKYQVINNYYDSNDNPIQKTLLQNALMDETTHTWLTYNGYQANSYHGENWNNILSPYAYLNHLDDPNGNRTIFTSTEYITTTGKYVNIYSLYDKINIEVLDKDDNVVIPNGTSITELRNILKSYIGASIDFAGIIVSSNDRNAYPDDGVVDKFRYKLKPELTKFITYTNSTAETLNVELFKNRYKYSHDITYFNRDTSLYNTVIGTTTSTNEESIPDASWRKYLGLYLGESIPFLGITETAIPDSEILGVPLYDKQINTSETLKYGTVASASLTFTVKLPVADAMLYNNEYLILYYDFTHLDEWKRMGFFYIDSIESIDENTSRIIGHDEVYKLNKYVDDFLSNYGSSATLDSFYRDLLDYCDCYYDRQETPILHGDIVLDNVYTATKTSGVETAHFIAVISPGFIHANIDGDVVMEQYNLTNIKVDYTKYSNLTYSAYNADLLDKVRITLNNEVVGEDSGTGKNIYFLGDDPLININWGSVLLNDIADEILETYNAIPNYRPATLEFLELPKFSIGDIFTIKSVNGDEYKAICMKMAISANGISVVSNGTQTYPVESSTNGQFINLLNTITSDIADIDSAQEASSEEIGAINRALGSLSDRIANVNNSVEDVEDDIDDINDEITNINGNITNLSNTVANMGVSASNNLASVRINGNTVNNLTQSGYVNNAITSATANMAVIKSGTLTYEFEDDINNDTISDTISVFYIGNNANTNGIMFPLGGALATGGVIQFKIDNGECYGLIEYNYNGRTVIFWTAMTFTFTGV